MARERYVIKPAGMMGINAAIPEIHPPSLFLPFQYNSSTTAVNGRIHQGRYKKRWGFGNQISAVDTGIALNIINFTQKSGSNDKTFYLTPDDFCLISDAGSGFAYKTQAATYTTTAQVDSISSTTVIFEGAATVSTDGVAAGDYFILDEDNSGSDPDVSWRSIASVDSETQITLDTSYEKDVGSPAAKDATIRRIYSGPSAAGNSYDLWSWCIVEDKLIFTCENDNTQYYDYTLSYATDLDSTNAVKAKFCIPYADRLILANCDSGGSQDPLLIKWSKNNDVTDWTDPTAGEAQLLDSGEYITGLGILSGYLVVFKPNSIIFGSKTGIPTAPIAFPNEKRGIGAFAPYSIVHADGKIFFMSRTNFYVLDGFEVKPIGNPIKDEIYDNYSQTEIKGFRGFHSPDTNEIWWFYGREHWVYAYDYAQNLWNFYQMDDTVGHHHGGGYSRKNSTDSTKYLWLGTTTQTGTNPTLSIFDSSAVSDRGLANASMNVKIMNDDDGTENSYSATVGAGDGYLETEDFDMVQSGNFFNISVQVSSQIGSVEVLRMEVEYEIGGEYYKIS
jgi:hypothetical protein